MSLLARLDRLPLSRPHYLLLLLGGLGYTFDGMDAAVVAFLMPSVQEVWGLTNTQLGLVGSAAPFGFLFGATCAGLLGDRIGRRKVMMWALAAYALFSVIAAVAPNYEIFLVARVLAGFGTGAESAIIAPFLAEFVPAARRGWFVGALAGFFSFGFVGAALLGRFVVQPLPEGWRWAQVITALPILMLLWWRRSLPESPRYLLATGRTAEAEQIVVDLERKVQAATKQPLPPVPETVVDKPAEARKIGLFSALKYLWSGGMAGRTAITWLIWFVITFSYYGFFTWIPTLLVQQGITVTKSFEFSIIIYLAQVPGYFSAAWLGEYLDRKNTIALYLAGAAASAFWMSQMTDPVWITVAAAVLSFFLNGTYAAVYSYTPEVFPTWIRASGTGLSSAFGRFGSIIAPSVIGVFAASLGFAGVFGITTAVLAVGVICTLVFGLSTAGRSLEDLTEPGSPKAAVR
ncbi:MFS transporter, putative metabolite:H+ symporter [Saccharopolyspora antimicrobica]|uniref:MFS transporter n=2 Tax=Saccharopolyspora TaxID=1835 RepID=A0A1I4SHP7_9PSEU|nr:MULTISPECIES: MFS transporter [Saccharopolyspora]RKT87748.1 putative MFS transporter [Saccharopolyspora antimicrobica]SEG97442.1 MFS transporter, putative metabolite:H+ symporter [Saccharopolyspora kobensis]SFC79371.1 MFS transporter, putative metabolite:H+ symporter [Saccharopolyspora kobensis]SFM63934.1 MFS transporter, putative metabolite:H+ symporter [Saccharopolyspora antimicrobica]